MNKTVQINLGGYPFTLDDAAYRRLDLYLHELEDYFQYSENAQEILSDIESRLAELLTQHLNNRKIVTMQEVADTIRIMGRPGDFEEETLNTKSETPPPRSGKGKGRPWDIRTGKRLFRDPNDKVIGGVCSGLSAYFGIEDPIWVRVGLVIFTITFGFGVLAYVVMWALVPEAKTAGDFLAMRGEKANAQNIAHMIERGIDDISGTIKENWQDFKAKKKTKNAPEQPRFLQEPPDRGLEDMNDKPNEWDIPQSRTEMTSNRKSPSSMLYKNLLV